MDLDFEVTYVSGVPNITLFTADLAWELYSEVISSGAPADIGTLTLDDSGADDYEVTIANGAGAGAANVGTINLDDAGFTGFSSIEGGHISGKLETGLTLVQDSLGAGGELTLTIDEHVTGAIVVPVVKGLTIGGDLSANLTVSDRLLSPGLDIDGNVGSSAVISIASTGPGAGVEIGAAGLLFEGDLVLLNGAVGGATVKIFSDLTSSASIDFNNASVNSTVECLGDNAGSIIDLSQLKNLLTLASGPGNAFSGTATILLLQATGIINTTDSADLTGQIVVTLDVLNKISVSGDLGSNGSIRVEDDLTGGNGEITINGDALGDIIIVDECTAVIQIDGDLSGDVDLQDAFTGSVTVDGSLKSTGRILVDFISVGSISIGEATQALSLIHLKGGLHEFGTVEVNTSKGNFNAVGGIHVGAISGAEAVTFDGCIHIYDEDVTGDGGALRGDITVVGCHATNADLNICVDGDISGDIIIDQATCANQVDYSCGTCP